MFNVAGLADNVCAVDIFRLTPSLKKQLLSSYNLDAVAAIQWGVNHEQTAIDQYQQLGAVVHKTGKMAKIVTQQQ